nr:hypothetical protein [Tanacetum cinerariifolium]
MLMCKQAEKDVPLRAEHGYWLDDTDEELDEQELEAHYIHMEKIKEANQNAKEYEDERVVLASLIANLKLAHDENKKTLKQLKKTNTSLTNELNELLKSQIPFVIDAKAVEQHHVESNRFQNKMKEVLNENELLLEQAIGKDIVNIVVTANVNNAYEPVNECERCVTLETELQNDFIKKECYDKNFKQYITLEKHCISLEVDTQLEHEIFQRNNSFSQQSVPSFDQLLEINELKAQSQEKDLVIMKLKERIKSLNGNLKEKKIKQEL